MQQQQTTQSEQTKFVRKTSMSLGVKLFLASFIVMFITLIFLVIFAITVKFQAEKIENQLEASYQNMQNVYSSVEKILTSSGITVKNFGETKINAIKEYVKQHANNPELNMHLNTLLLPIIGKNGLAKQKVLKNQMLLPKNKLMKVL
jgi:C4-dicarboxylate transporter